MKLYIKQGKKALLLSLVLFTGITLNAMEQQDKPEYSSFVDNLEIVLKRNNKQLCAKLLHHFNEEIEQKEVIEQVSIVANLIPYAAQKSNQVTSVLCNALVKIVQANDSLASIIKEKINPVIHTLVAHQRKKALKKLLCIFADNTESEEYTRINQIIQSKLQKGLTVFNPEENSTTKEALKYIYSTIDLIQESISNPQRTVIFCNMLLGHFISQEKNFRTDMQKIISPIIHPLIQANNIEALKQIRYIFSDFKDKDTQEYKIIHKAIKKYNSVIKSKQNEQLAKLSEKSPHEKVATEDNDQELNFARTVSTRETTNPSATTFENPIDFMRLQKESAELTGVPLSDEEADAFLIRILEEHIDNHPSCKKIPKTFYEALVRLQCIARLFDKTRFYIGDMEITENDCVINNLVLPHHMTNKRFKQCFDIVKNRTVLLSHEKSVEAINIILESISKKVKPETAAEYIKAINCLPSFFSHNIKKQFNRMMYQELYNIPLITTGLNFIGSFVNYDIVKTKIKPYEVIFDEEDRITSFKFKKSGINVEISNIHWIGQDPWGKAVMGSETCYGTDLNNLHTLLNRKFEGRATYFDENDFIWRLNFEEMLQKRAHENENKTQEKQQSKCIIS